jgi:hypothetical protein
MSAQLLPGGTGQAARELHTTPGAATHPVSEGCWC